MDTKHSNLVHVSLSSHPAWLSPHHAGLIRSVCANVKGRTGCEGYIDIHRRELCWGYHNQGDPAIVYSWPIFRHFFSSTPNRFEMSTDDCLDISVDDVCYAIQMARVSPERKELWGRYKSQQRESSRINRMGNIIHDGVRDASKDQEFRSRRPVSA